MYMSLLLIILLFEVIYFWLIFLSLQINIAALRIAADKFDPEFIDKRKVALEVSLKCSMIFSFVILWRVSFRCMPGFWWEIIGGSEKLVYSTKLKDICIEHNLMYINVMKTQGKIHLRLWYPQRYFITVQNIIFIQTFFLSTPLSPFFICCHCRWSFLSNRINFCPVSFQSFLLRCGAHPQISQDLSFISFFNQVHDTKLINS